MNRKLRTDMYMKVIRDLRNRMSSMINKHTGPFPNFIGVASNFWRLDNNFCGSTTPPEEAVENAAKFFGVEIDNPIFKLRNPDGSKPLISPSLVEIEVAVENLLNEEPWNFNEIHKTQTRKETA